MMFWYIFLGSIMLYVFKIFFDRFECIVNLRRQNKEMKLEICFSPESLLKPESPSQVIKIKEKNYG